MAENAQAERERQDQEKAEENKARQLRQGVVSEEEPKANLRVRLRPQSQNRGRNGYR